MKGIFVALLLVTASTARGQVFTDDFNRADGPLGSNWASTSSGPSPAITSNQACAGAASEAFARYAQALDSAAQIEIDADLSGTDKGPELGFHLISTTGGLSVASFELRKFGAEYGVEIALNGSTQCASDLFAFPILSAYSVVASLAPNGFAYLGIFPTSGGGGTALVEVECAIGPQDLDSVVTSVSRSAGSGTACFDNFRVFATAATTCNNGTQDGDETGRDCGGSCAACVVPGCPQDPKSGCSAAPRAKLSLGKSATNENKDKLSWSWSKGGVKADDLADPSDDSAYRLCIYDGSTQLLHDVNIPAAGTCGDKPCWKASASGYRMKDKAGTNGGITGVGMKAGEAGKGKISIKGAGKNLADKATFPLKAPLRVQLQNVATGACWQSLFTADNVKKNDATKGKFKASVKN